MGRKYRLWMGIVQWGLVPLVIAAIVVGLIAYAARSEERGMCVPPDPTMTCEQYAHHFGHKKARQFRHGRLGDAEGMRLPRKYKRALRHYWAHHDHARDLAERDGRPWDWWKYPLEEWACAPMLGMGYRVSCENGAEHHRQFVRGVRRVTVACAGFAAIGAIAGGGAGGAGKGALACVWTNIGLRVLDLGGFFRG